VLSLIRHLAFALAVGRMLCATASAQSSAAPLTLRDVANIVLERSTLRKAALAHRKAASAGVCEAQCPCVTWSRSG
jgi:hypothetical protein